MLPDCIEARTRKTSRGAKFSWGEPDKRSQSGRKSAPGPEATNLTLIVVLMVASRTRNQESGSYCEATFYQRTPMVTGNNSVFPRPFVCVTAGVSKNR